LLDERQSLPPAEYGRERLGWWDKPDVAEAPKITSEAWAALKDSGSTPVDPVSFGIYINKDRTSSAIGVAAYRADGLIHVGVVPARDGEQFDQLPGTGWIPGQGEGACGALVAVRDGDRHAERGGFADYGD
jgi:hypothetical protein